MIRNEDNPENSVLPIVISPLTEPRRQVQFCQNLITNLFEKGERPCTKKIPGVKIKRQFLDQYLKGIYVVAHHNMESTQKKSDHQMIFMTDINSR